MLSTFIESAVRFQQENTNIFSTLQSFFSTLKILILKTSEISEALTKLGTLKLNHFEFLILMNTRLASKMRLFTSSKCMQNSEHNTRHV